MGILNCSKCLNDFDRDVEGHTVDEKEYCDACVPEEYTDKEMLDFLQALTDKAKYTGKCILRDSTIGRGWRLHETGWEGCTPSVREAISNYMRTYKEEQCTRNSYA